MNTGIQDAMSLAEALHTHLQTGDERALDLWQEERLQVDGRFAMRSLVLLDMCRACRTFSRRCCPNSSTDKRKRHAASTMWGTVS